MPPVSQAQRRAMYAAAAGKSNIGIPQSVGKEFTEADPGGKLPERKKSQEGGGVDGGLGSSLWQGVRGFGRALGEDIGNIGRGLYQAGPGALERLWTGQEQVGSPEAIQDVAATGLTYGMLPGAVRAAGLGTASPEPLAPPRTWEGLEQRIGEAAQPSPSVAQPYDPSLMNPQTPRRPYEQVPPPSPAPTLTPEFWQDWSARRFPDNPTRAQQFASWVQNVPESYQRTLATGPAPEELRQLYPTPTSRVPLTQLEEPSERPGGALIPGGRRGLDRPPVASPGQRATTQAPPDIRLVNKTPEGFAPHHVFELQDPEGNYHGYMQATEMPGDPISGRPSTLHVGGMYSVGGEGYFTPTQIKDFGRQLRQQFPDVRRITATRIGGARAAAGTPGRAQLRVGPGTSLPAVGGTGVGLGALNEEDQGMQEGGNISYQRPSAAFRREHPTTSKGPVSQQQRRLIWATVGGADTQMPEAVARRFARSDAPGKLPKFVHEGRGLGSRPRRQFGGESMMRPISSADMPYWTRAAARQDAYMDQSFPGGLIPSTLAGRSDRLPLAVPGESHIIPAQEVAGVGQGNSMAGGRLLMAALSMARQGGPFGLSPPKVTHGPGEHIPRPPAEPRTTTQPATAAPPETRDVPIDPAAGGGGGGGGGGSYGYQEGGSTDQQRPRQILRDVSRGIGSTVQGLRQQARGAWSEIPGRAWEGTKQFATAMNPFSEYDARGEGVHAMDEALYGGLMPFITRGYASPGLPEVEATIGGGPGALSRAAYAVSTSEAPHMVHLGHEVGEKAPEAAAELAPSPETAIPGEETTPILGGQMALPYTPQAATAEHTMQRGGEAPRRDETSILAAGGEFVVPREDWWARDEHGNLVLHAGVRTIGEGDIAKGHQRLNHMIQLIRAHTLKFLKNAPPPKE